MGKIDLLPFTSKRQYGNQDSCHDNQDGCYHGNQGSCLDDPSCLSSASIVPSSWLDSLAILR